LSRCSASRSRRLASRARASAWLSGLRRRAAEAGAFANTAEEAAAEALYPELVPEPHGPIFETLPLAGLDGHDIPTAYVHCRHDHTLPPGTFHPGQSRRLGAPALIEVDGDHEALLTAPDRLASALLDAVAAMALPRRRAAVPSA
jgi:hypothetical protein